MPLSTEAKTLVRAARRAERGPGRDSRERMRRNVLAAVGVSAAAATAAATATGTGAVTTGAAATTTTAGTVLGLGIGAKIGVAVVLVGLVGGGAALAVRAFSPEIVPTNTTHIEIAAGDRASLGATGALSPEPESGPGPAALEETPEPDPKPPEAAPSVARSAAGSVPPAAAGDDLQAENELLGRAQRALGGGDTGGAMAALDEHASRFPKGSLTVERRAVRALTLCAMGKKAEGLREAAPLLAAGPDDPLAARITHACR